jgi:hypothetical protein
MPGHVDYVSRSWHYPHKTLSTRYSALRGGRRLDGVNVKVIGSGMIWISAKHALEDALGLFDALGRLTPRTVPPPSYRDQE